MGDIASSHYVHYIHRIFMALFQFVSELKSYLSYVHELVFVCHASLHIVFSFLKLFDYFDARAHAKT